MSTAIKTKAKKTAKSTAVKAKVSKKKAFKTAPLKKAARTYSARASKAA